MTLLLFISMLIFKHAFLIKSFRALFMIKVHQHALINLVYSYSGNESVQHSTRSFSSVLFVTFSGLSARADAVSIALPTKRSR